ncbi:hypothetical protein A9Q99_24140 [Gammaproteobacteria bacterium 45_16_T64]|nr:hypothetical protein A9Q99_24140 [Gammaproteobacteria bacterium 45_16_T64]
MTVMFTESRLNTDPIVPDWENIELPPAWPDQLKLNTLSDLCFLFSKVFGRRARVSLPEGMPGADIVPNYMLQEFHHLPNGYYSSNLTKGYVTSFDVVMLGLMDQAKLVVTKALEGVDSALDVGCGGGRVANGLMEQGVEDVWGVDPSPYLLKQAAVSFPGVKFIQGAAEKLAFPDERFAGIGICFLLHEIPPKYASIALSEFHRVLKPNGLISIAEPSPLQINESSFALVKKYGWRGLYFKLLALKVFEPFVDAWHKRNLSQWFSDHGFEIVKDNIGMPFRHIVVKKV